MVISLLRLIIDKTGRRWARQINRIIRDETWKSSISIVLATTIFILTLQYVSESTSNENGNGSTIDGICRKLNANHANSYRTIYVITPTYSRFVQKAELTRLSNTLMLIPNLHWIIVEDSNKLSHKIGNLIRRLSEKFGFNSVTHLCALTPNQFKLKPGEPNWKYPKGVWQRNRALEWLRNNSNDVDRDGVIYFADDDNTYDLELFEEIRRTQLISVWPVAFAGGLLVEKPLVHKDNSSKVVSFNSMWRKERPFPIDMAGFAVSVRLYLSKQRVKFSHNQPIGYLESHFISQLVNSWDDLEPRAYHCKKVLVWHTKTQAPSLHEEKKLITASINDMDY